MKLQKFKYKVCKAIDGNVITPISKIKIIKACCFADAANRAIKTTWKGGNREAREKVKV